MEAFIQITAPPTFENRFEADITPEDLRGFSIREVHWRYGSKGLDFLIYDELQKRGLEDDAEIIAAFSLGMILHKDDMRSDGGDYCDHLRRCMLRVMREYQIEDPAIIAAMPLHDGVEDHPKEILTQLGISYEGTNPQVAAIDALSSVFSNETVDIVATMTFPKFPKAQKAALYAARTRKVISPHPKARVGKLADFEDNACENGYTQDPALQLRLDIKQLPAYGVHYLGLYEPGQIIPQHLIPGIATRLAVGYHAALERVENASKLGLLDASA